MKTCSDFEESSSGGDILNLEQRVIYIYQEIQDDMAIEFSKAMSELKKTPFDIEIKINSPGGELYSTISIISEIKNCPNFVTTNITAMAYSGASMIALSGDLRKAFKHSSIMYHEMFISAADSANKLKTNVKKQEQLFYKLMEDLLRNTSISKKEFSKLIQDTDWYLSPSEALKYNLIMEIY